MIKCLPLVSKTTNRQDHFQRADLILVVVWFTVGLLSVINRSSFTIIRITLTSSCESSSTEYSIDLQDLPREDCIIYNHLNLYDPYKFGHSLTFTCLHTPRHSNLYCFLFIQSFTLFPPYIVLSIMIK